MSDSRVLRKKIWTYKGRNKQKDGENFILRRFIAYSAHHVMIRVIKSK
jgi:hypothetical protein